MRNTKNMFHILLCCPCFPYLYCWLLSMLFLSSLLLIFCIATALFHHMLLLLLLSAICIWALFLGTVSYHCFLLLFLFAYLILPVPEFLDRFLFCRYLFSWFYIVVTEIDISVTEKPSFVASIKIKAILKPSE